MPHSFTTPTLRSRFGLYAIAAAAACSFFIATPALAFTDAGGTVPTPGSPGSPVGAGGTGNFGATDPAGGAYGGGGGGYGGAVGGAAGGTAACSVKLLETILGTAGATGGVAAGAAGGGAPVYDIGANVKLGFIAGQQFNQTAIQSANTKTDFSSCIVRAISRALLQQMTISVVNWINSGFNGSPSFVTNYQQFFTQVADKAVGNFLQGSDLAFLCSPFKLQIKVAVAQAYAKRNAAPQCSLTKVVSNLNRFVNNFSQGGWRGLIAFTTVPTNNPYGAYMDVQARLNNTVASNQGVQGLDLSLGRGFLSFSEEKCTHVGPGGVKTGCTTKISTPGTTIANQLDTTLGTNFRQLELAQSFDQIFSALINQLLVKTLQGGLSNLNAQNGFGSSPGDLAGAASGFAQGLDVVIGTAEQVKSVLGQNVSDIQAAEVKVLELDSCWTGFATSTDLTTAERAEAAANASSTLAVYNNLEQSRVRYAARISTVDAQIQRLHDYQSAALSAISLQQLQNIVQDYTANSAGFPNAATLQSAVQDRTEVSAGLSTLLNNTASKLDECHAFPPTQTP